MAYKQDVLPLKIHHAHNGKEVVLIFSQQTQSVNFTPEQARAFMAGMQGSLDMLERHLKGEPEPLPPVALQAPAANEGQPS